MFVLLAGSAGALSDVSQFKVKNIPFFGVIVHWISSLKLSILFLFNTPETYQFCHYSVNNSKVTPAILLLDVGAQKGHRKG